MKYLIVAAKTGGHVYPAATIGKKLINNNHEIVLLGTGNDIEKNAYKNLDSKLYEISIEGFRGGSIFHKMKVIYQGFINIFKVIKILKKNKVSAMIGFGGFVTVPAGIACRISRIPIFIHEQNAVMGSANKLLSKIAKINFLGFPIKKIDRSILSGNPIRESFINNIDDTKSNQNAIRVYVTGGSQGANFINQHIPIALNELAYNIKIKHQCGKNNFNKVNDLYKTKSFDVEVSEFYDDPAQQILWSDFVISRAGALSLSEIVSLKRGALIIPLPTSIDNHQVENARSIQKIKMGILHEEKDGKEELKNKLNNIIEKKLYLDWRNFHKSEHIYASKIILNYLEDYFKT